MSNNTVKIKKQGEFSVVLKRLYKNRAAMIGLVLFILVIIAAILAPLIMPYPYEKMDLLNTFSAPSASHLFGTDHLGRDILSRILYGARYSLSIGVAAVLVSVVVGAFFGAIAGYFGGAVDNVILRFVDVLQAIPGLLLAIAVSAALGPGFFNSVMALGVGGIPMHIRLLRASILGIRRQEYLEAAESINCGKARIIIRHVLPNSLSPLIVSATMGIGNTMLTAASLSFIGLGVQPPMPEWGAMLSEGRNYIRDYPHMVIVPGIFILITVLFLNMLGDGLRDALDPKLKN